MNILDGRSIADLHVVVSVNLGRLLADPGVSLQAVPTLPAASHTCPSYGRTRPRTWSVIAPGRIT